MTNPNSSIDTLEFLGNSLCLDFVNTAEYRELPHGKPVKDLLDTLDALIAWAARAKVISAAQEKILRKIEQQNSAAASRFWRSAVALREDIYRVFAALAHGKNPLPKDLDALSTLIAHFQAQKKLQRRGAVYGWAWTDSLENVEIILGPIIEAASALLTKGPLDRVRQCTADQCGWLFLDTSRNGTRRWCDMRDCGNRAKARRFYAKSKD